MDDLKDRLHQAAKRLGFVRLAVAEATPLVAEGQRLRDWLAAGHHGEMAYMASTAEVRADVGHDGMLPGARSVVVMATPYARAAASIGPSPGLVARYARGRDYHNLLAKRARKLARLIDERGHRTRVAVDALPVFERAWAARAGLGFIGKNCCLIIPGVGSHVLLAVLVTTAELEPDAPIAERCGQCRACLDACPTNAFVAPRQLDGRRCVSYLTIECRGPIAEDLREGLGERIFGCDACQDVCPYNHTAPPAPEQTEPFAPNPRFGSRDALALLTMDEATFRSYAMGSPLKRPGRAGMARNAAIVLGNRGDRRHLPTLRAANAEDPDPVVRDAAAWAIAAIDRRGGESPDG